MFSYKYLSSAHLKGFDNYKYSAIDTSPLSNYVMHPTWNTLVKFIPNFVAPNLLTFLGFVCMVLDVGLLTYYDYSYTAAGARAGPAVPVPPWVYTACGVLLFLAYNLDGLDGKQARKLGVSGPLGELFDHGIDSYIVFMIPFCLISCVGRDEWSVPAFRGFLVVMSIVVNFYVSHWEKYNTGTLFLPWGYDLSMWVSSFLFILVGSYGPGVFKSYLFGELRYVLCLEILIHMTGLFTTLPVALYNIYMSYKNRTGKMLSPTEAVRPLWPLLTISGTMIYWALKSHTDIIERDFRAFMFLYGTLFSNTASRLIVAMMGSQRCDVINLLSLPLIAGVALSIYQPALELMVLYSLLLLSVTAHLHYAICVVRQLCGYFNIRCFVVPKSKQKVQVKPKPRRK